MREFECLVRISYIVATDVGYLSLLRYIPSLSLEDKALYLLSSELRSNQMALNLPSSISTSSCDNSFLLHPAKIGEKNICSPPVSLTAVMLDLK